MYLLNESQYPYMCDIPNEEYQEHPAISNTALGVLMDCPYVYYKKYIVKSPKAKLETESLKFGKIIHAYLLENDSFFDRYAVIPNIRRGTKVFQKYEEENKGKELIKESDYEKCVDILESINSNPFHKTLISNGDAEKSIFWKDKETEILCKTRPDYIKVGKGRHDFILDVKKVKSARPEYFDNAINFYGYHRQAAMMIEGYKALTGYQVPNFFHLIIEDKYPYCASVIRMSEEKLKKGYQLFREGLNKYKECFEKNYWHQYVETMCEL